MRVLACLLSLLCAPYVCGDTVLIDFTATWCTPCKTMAPIVAGLAREGYNVRVVDVDRNREMAQKYRVSNIPTFVVVRDGKEISRLSGDQVTAADFRRVLGPVSSRNSQSHPDSGSRSRATRRAERLAPHDFPMTSVAKERLGVTVRLTMNDVQSKSFATGTVIRSLSGEVIILTCSHLFDGVSNRSKLTAEFFGAHDRVILPAELLGRDPVSDVALARVRTDREFPVAPVAGTNYAFKLGSPVLSVGCDNGADPTVWAMKIADVDRYHEAPTIECTRQPVQGRSGGGLFSDRGEIIGLCSAADPRLHRGIYAGLRAIHKLLNQKQLASIYKSPSRQGQLVGAGSAIADRRPKPSNDIALANNRPWPPRKRTGKFELPTPTQLGLEIRNPLLSPDSRDAEFVFVLKDPQNPVGQSQVVILKQLTPELRSTLEKEFNRSRNLPANSKFRRASDHGQKVVPAMMKKPDRTPWRAVSN